MAMLSTSLGLLLNLLGTARIWLQMVQLLTPGRDTHLLSMLLWRRALRSRKPFPMPVKLPPTAQNAINPSTLCEQPSYVSKFPTAVEHYADSFFSVVRLLESNFANVESVVITYQALTFVCFQSGGILLNRNTFSAMPDLRVGDANSMKRKDTDFSEDEAMKRLRTANLQHDNQDTPVPMLDLASWQSHVPQQGVSLRHGYWKMGYQADQRRVASTDR